MTGPAYRNFGHYIREGWSAEPKQTFLRLADVLRKERAEPAGTALDVGCATGELLAFLTTEFPGLSGTGVDVFDELLVEGRRLLPAAKFVKGSALDLPHGLRGVFDIVTAIGVMSVFDETQIEAFWRNLAGAARPGGLVVVLSPVNEHGVDTMIRHRKRAGGKPLAWETGWNIHAMETVREIVTSLGMTLRFERFVFEGRLTPREDPVRTWTMATESNPNQLTNGLKLLVDHYFMIAQSGKG